MVVAPIQSHENQLVDEILLEICERLQISDSQYQEAVRSYEAVGEWLRAPESPLSRFDLVVYPQGSMALGTTVKPRASEEFDIDLVLEVGHWPDGPMALYEETLRRLEGNGRYREILEPLRRCIRLNYAGQFHLDVLPARADLSRGGTCIEVPDRKLREWKPSNPKGFCGWFEKSSQRGVVTRAAEQEPVPANQTSEQKTTLQRAVQLSKRHRDVRFEGDEDRAPRSVVLTTLAAEAYDGESSISATLFSVLTSIEARIEEAAPSQIVVPNPTNPDELFSESWSRDPGSYELFVGYVRELRAGLADLLEVRGIQEVAALAGEFFGEGVAQFAVEKVAERLGEAKDRGALKVGAAGIITGGAGRSIPRHSFYGK